VRYLILSDIHSNWQALEAVLAHAAGAYDRILCCGDLVGYGADPNRVVDWSRENVRGIVRGNHDKGCAGLDDLEWFNNVARNSALWTQSALSSANLQYLERLPRGPLAIEGFRLVHGSPLDEDEYVLSDADIAGVSGYLEAPLYFFGHTHIQGGFRLAHPSVSHLGDVRDGEGRRWFDLEHRYAYLINPGSVGQPRDRDPRAAYALYDSGSRAVALCRVSYDIEEAQARILKAGLPPLLAERLAVGF
jgi:diadenosine tetraphosphatase ApaH/serine/threonine PP2A family protein phosphatase